MLNTLSDKYYCIIYLIRAIPICSIFINSACPGVHALSTCSSHGFTNEKIQYCCSASPTFVISACIVCPLLLKRVCWPLSRFLRRTHNTRGSFERYLWRGQGISKFSSLKPHNSFASCPLQLYIPILNCHFQLYKWCTYSWLLVFLKPFSSSSGNELQKGKKGWFLYEDANRLPKLSQILSMCLFLCLTHQSALKSFS